MTETYCADDIDEDGDYYPDCLDDDCAASSACSSQLCDSVAQLDCSSKLVHGDTASAAATTNIADYSCMPTVDFGNAEIAYEFQYDTGPDTREVLVTLSNETGYAAVAVLGNRKVSVLELTIANTTNRTWSEGLLALEELITKGPSPQPSSLQYYTYAFAHRDCDVDDAYCTGSCDDDGFAPGIEIAAEEIAAPGVAGLEIGTL